MRLWLSSSSSGPRGSSAGRSDDGARPRDRHGGRRHRRPPAGGGAISGQARPGDPDLGHFCHEPRSPHGLHGHGVIRPLRFLRHRRLHRGPPPFEVAGAPRRPRRASPRGGAGCAPHRLSLHPRGRRVLHHAHPGLLTDVLRPDFPERLPRGGGRHHQRAAPERLRSRPHLARGVSRLPPRHRRRRGGVPPSRGALAFRSCAARHSRQRRAHAGRRLRRAAPQAPRLRHRGHGGGGGGVALHSVRRIHLSRRVSLDHLGGGAPHGDHRRHGHAERGMARCRGLHSPAEPGQLVHRTLDAHPGAHLRPLRPLRPGRHRGGPAGPGGSALVTTALLSIETLTRNFGALSALAGVSLALEARERRAVIGPNGAGKTTLFNVITGQLPPSGGRIVFDGHAIAGLPPDAVARRGVSRSFQRTNLFPRLPVLENLRLAAAARTGGSYNLLGLVERAMAPLALAHETAAAVGLADRISETAGRLSYGEQRQLEVGVALATRPKLLLLDEPTAGMSPEETDRMTRMLEGLPREVTLLIIEHDMDVVASLADRVTVLHHGEVLVEGSFAEVKADPRVYEVYLGSAGWLGSAGSLGAS